MQDAIPIDWLPHKRQHQALMEHLQTAREGYAATPDDALRGQVFDALSEMLAHAPFED